MFAYVTLIKRHESCGIKASENPLWYLPSLISLCEPNHQTMAAGLLLRQGPEHPLHGICGSNGAIVGVYIKGLISTKYVHGSYKMVKIRDSIYGI